jgi:two-component system LytT family sensor kinase
MPDVNPPTICVTLDRVHTSAQRQPSVLSVSLISALVVATASLLKFWYLYLDDLARDRSGTFVHRALEEGTGLFAATVLVPAIVWTSRRFRFGEAPWWRLVPIHLGVAIVLSIAHTTLMGVSRAIVFPLVGMGSYDYGVMRWRYPMEFSNFVVMYAIFVGALNLFDYYRELRNRQIAAAELETRLAQAQLQNLQLQLQPHFLFNVLNTISSVMYEDIARADTMLAQLSDLLRRTLRRPDAQQVPLEEEIETVRMYVRIMQERFGDDLRVEVTMDPDVAQMLVPQLLLQPLVENSIRHGAGKTPLEVTVRAARSEGELLLRVSDNGPGLQSATIEKGIGLTNTAERLAALYGERHRLIFDNIPGGGLMVSVRIPLQAATA